MNEVSPLSPDEVALIATIRMARRKHWALDGVKKDHQFKLKSDLKVLRNRVKTQTEYLISKPLEDS